MSVSCKIAKKIEGVFLYLRAEGSVPKWTSDYVYAKPQDLLKKKGLRRQLEGLALVEHLDLYIVQKEYTLNEERTRVLLKVKYNWWLRFKYRERFIYVQNQYIDSLNSNIRSMRSDNAISEMNLNEKKQEVVRLKASLVELKRKVCSLEKELRVLRCEKTKIKLLGDY